MFKDGDKIICLDQWSSIDKSVKINLTQYKEYTVLFTTFTYGYHYVHVINDQGDLQNFVPNRFVSVTAFRKHKLEKICSNLVK